jgi:hypothetical protein
MAKKPAKAKVKAKTTFWRSKEAKRVYWLFGIPVVGILVWYSYTVVFELNKPAMSKMESEMKENMSALAERAMKEGFRPEDVDNCQNMIKEYTTPKGWNYSGAEMHQLVGLKRNATKKEMDERCVYYAKAVAKMEKMSHHTRHVFVCGKSILDIGGNGRYYIKPDPKGRGAVQNFDPNRDKLMKIRKESSTVLQYWQIHNVGDGCIIVGLSKSATFRMSGKVKRE